MKKSVILVCTVLFLVTLTLGGCAKDKEEMQKTVKYSLGNMSFEVFNDWTLDDESSDEQTLSFIKGTGSTEKAVRDSIKVESKEVSFLDKIDIGKGAVKTKEDVVKKYSYGTSEFVDLTSSEWKNTNDLEYCEQYFEVNGKLADGTTGKRFGREIVVPINETEAYFIALLVGDEKKDLDDLVVIIDSLHETPSEQASVTAEGKDVSTSVPVETSTAISSVEKAFTDATTMTIKDLTKINGRWTYRELQLLTEDEEWVNDTLNKKGTVNQGAIYRKMAMLLEGFNAKLNDYHSYAELLLGFIPDTRDEFATYASKLERFICTKDQLKSIMHVLEDSSNVQGSFDYNTNSFGAYSVKINNVFEVARELQITEEMFGYMLAELTEYGVSVSFSQEKCTLSY